MVIGTILGGITTWFHPTGVVIFGVLHGIGLSIICSLLFCRGRRRYAIAVGVLLIVLGALFKGITVSGPWLLWMGLRDRSMHMLDYYPLAPWMGATLLGLALGMTLYPGGRRSFSTINPSGQRCFV